MFEDPAVPPWSRIRAAFYRERWLTPSADHEIRIPGVTLYHVAFGGDGAIDFCEFDVGFSVLLTDLRRKATLETKAACKDVFEFHIRLSNSLELTSDSQTTIIDPGSALLLYVPPSGELPIRIRSNGSPDRSVTFYCSKTWLEAVVPAIGQDNTLPSNLSVPLSPTGLQSIFPVSPGDLAALEILFASARTTGLDLLALQARLVHLLSHSLNTLLADRHLPPPENRRSDAANFAHAHEILRSEFADPPSLPDLARRVGLNTTKLSAGFRCRYGLTIKEFVQSMRLDEARRLLVNTRMSVGEVAMEVGYAHHSTFTAAFIHRFGISPKERTQVRKLDETTGTGAALQ